jgi:hypothetical protein
MVVVVQLSGGVGELLVPPEGVGAVSPLTLPVLVGAPDPPEHAPYTDGWHTKPLPQSASALQGSCHRYAHLEVVVVVQMGGVTSAGVSHFVFGGQAGAVLPEHAVLVSVWQTMSVPQSVSVVQGPGSQVEIVIEALVPLPEPDVAPEPLVAQSSSGAQLAFGGVATPVG